MKEWFYTVTQSMVELGLRGAELSLFAILNGYSQRAEGCFFGTRYTLAEQCGIKSTRTIDATLRSLIDKGLIRRYNITISGREYIAYSVVGDWGVSKNCAPQSKNCSKGEQKLRTEGAKIAHNKNIYKEHLNNNTPPTPSDVADYCRSRGWSDPEGFADYYIAYQTEAGWKTKEGKPIENWKLNVLVWERYHKEETYSTKQPQGKLRQMTEAEYLESIKK